MKPIFDQHRLGRADYVLLSVLFLPIFMLFFHGDIGGVGLDSLNYLFGHPLEFYENCLAIRGGGKHMGGTPYPPTIYLIFALWLLPFKVLGILDSPNEFPIHLVYWLKILTTMVYAWSAILFYKVCLLYFQSKEHAKYAAIAWLAMPVAFFSQFIFSQYDIFYVALTIAGFLMFLKERIFLASTIFGIAITFKYFPVFVYIPLLLLFEKRIFKIIINIIIFSLPITILDLIYKNSFAYNLGVKNHASIEKIYAASLNIGCCDIYYIFAGFILISGLSYFYDVTKENRTVAASYVWLTSSILPFLFIAWHPQWTIFFIPPIILTTLLHTKHERFFLLDLFGMICFVGIIALLFQRTFGTDMLFAGRVLGIPLKNSHAMGDIFDHFGSKSGFIYLTGFWSYLILQIAVKYKELTNKSYINLFKINYSTLRVNLFIGLAVFFIPTIYALHQSTYSSIASEKGGRHFGELTKGRVFSQSFIAKDRYLKNLQLYLATFARKNNGILAIEIVSSNNEVLYTVTQELIDIPDNRWITIPFQNLKLVIGEPYKIDLRSPDAAPGNAITWWASETDTFAGGSAIVDGLAYESDFMFKMTFSQFIF